jgi:hypothetical protein
MPKYKIASQEGADRYKAEIGDFVDLEIKDEELTAVVAAGWIEPAKEGK